MGIGFFSLKMLFLQTTLFLRKKDSTGLPSSLKIDQNPPSRLELQAQSVHRQRLPSKLSLKVPKQIVNHLICKCLQSFAAKNFCNECCFCAVQKWGPAEKFFHISYIWLHSETRSFQGAEILEFQSSNQIYPMRLQQISLNPEVSLVQNEDKTYYFSINVPVILS